MLQPIYTKHFEKDIALCKKRNYDMETFKSIAKLLLEEQPLPKKYKDHKLYGTFNKHRECHIIFERTCSHSDLFG